jgi:L-aspartate oxidase
VAGRAVEITADATVLAAGGCGQVYRLHDEPAGGHRRRLRDRLRRRRAAHRHGVRAVPPHALDTPENPLALVSEAVRGEGADARERRAASGSWRADTRSPSWRRATSSRREIFREQQRHGRVYLDAAGSSPGGKRFAERFPGITACAGRAASIRTAS